MKRLVSLLLLCLGLSFISQAQKAKGQVKFKTDTIYFDQDWQKTFIKQDRKYARIINRTWNRQPYGTVRDYYYPAWTIQWEGKLLSENPDVATGVCTFYYPNGKVQSTATYVNNLPQSDLLSWKEDGTKIVCTYKYVEALPLTKAKLHSYYNEGSSRQVIHVDIPENSVGLIYKIDIRDEGQPPITWNMAGSLAVGALTAGPGGMLAAGAKSLAESTINTAPPTVSTKCHFFITPSIDDARYFINSKGSMGTNNQCLRYADNVTDETRTIEIPQGIKRIYFCLNNDNLQTPAQATLSVSILQKQCE